MNFLTALFGHVVSFVRLWACRVCRLFELVVEQRAIRSAFHVCWQFELVCSVVEHGNVLIFHELILCVISHLIF